MTWEEQWSDPETVAKWLRPSVWVEEVCAGLSPPLRGLDLGCGPGRHTVFLASRGFEAWGAELTQAGAQLCRDALRRSGLRGSVVRSNMSNLPFGAETFDLVVAYNVIYHTTRRGMREVIEEIARILRPGGRFLVTLKTPEEWVYGQGEEIEPDTFLRDRKGLPIHFCREAEIPGLFDGFDLVSKRYLARTKEIPGKGERRLARWLLVLRKPGPVPASGNGGPRRATESPLSPEEARAREVGLVLARLEDRKEVAGRLATALGTPSLADKKFGIAWKKVRRDEGRIEALLRPRREEKPLVYVRWPEERRAGAPGRLGWDDGMLFQLFPQDEALPGLAAALDEERISRWIRSLGRDPGSAVRARVLRYKPGKRCVVEYEPVDGGKGWVGKVYPADLGAQVFRKWKALHGAFDGEAPLPEPIALDESISLLLAARLEGKALLEDERESRLDGFRRAGRLLARLHAVGPLSELPERTLEEESLRARGAGEKLAVAAGVLAPAALSFAARLADGLSCLVARRTACHGEWDPGQVLFSDRGAWMFDLDNARNAHPALDLGSFAANLERLWFCAPEETADAERAFLAGYRDGGGEVDADALRLYRDVKRLRIALTLARRRGPRWERRLARLLSTPS